MMLMWLNYYFSKAINPGSQGSVHCHKHTCTPASFLLYHNPEGAQTSRCRPWNHPWKKLGNEHGKHICWSKVCQKPAKCALEIHPKSPEIQAWSRRCPFLCSQVSLARPVPKWRQYACQTTSLDTNNESIQKCQGSKVLETSSAAGSNGAPIGGNKGK